MHSRVACIIGRRLAPSLFHGWSRDVGFDMKHPEFPTLAQIHWEFSKLTLAQLVFVRSGFAMMSARRQRQQAQECIDFYPIVWKFIRFVTVSSAVSLASRTLCFQAHALLYVAGINRRSLLRIGPFGIRILLRISSLLAPLAQLVFYGTPAQQAHCRCPRCEFFVGA